LFLPEGAILSAHLLGNQKELLLEKGVGVGVEVEGAIMLAQLSPEISSNGALLVLSLMDNKLCAEGGEALAAGLKGNQGVIGLGSPFELNKPIVDQNCVLGQPLRPTCAKASRKPVEGNT
jgi:hypothetical protein